MKFVFTHIYNFFSSRKPLFYFIFFLCFIVTGFFASRLRFEEDISSIIPKDKKIEKLTRVFQDSKFTDKLVMMVTLADTASSAQPDSLVTFADQLVTRLETNLSSYIAKINYKIDDEISLTMVNTINDHLPVYLDKSDYRSIDSLIQPQRVRQTLQSNLRTLTSPAGLALKNIISKDPVGITFLALRKMQDLQYDENFELYDNHILTKDQKNLIFFVTPKYPPNNTGENALMLAAIDKITDSLSTNSPGIKADYFGAVAVSVGNALQLRRDSIYTQGIVVVFIILFLGFYFRKKRAPLIIMIPVVFGAVFSLAAIYFIKGSISVIALGTGSVVLGIAVNYSLHVFNHYRHTRSIEQVITDLSLPMTIGSITTIGGFLCLQFVESEMLQDLGLFAAFSLIGASLCSLIFLPHLIISGKEPVTQMKKGPGWIDKIASLRPESNRLLVLGIIILTIVFAYTSKWVSFESDMMRMNYMPEKLKESEARLNTINAYALQSVYLVSEGRTLDEALVNNEKLVSEVDKLKEYGVVKKYSGVSALILSDSLQNERIRQWNRYWTPVKKRLLLSVLEKEGLALKFKTSAFDNFRSLLNKDFRPADKETMSEIRKNFLDDYITEKPGMATVVTLVKVSPGQKQVIHDVFEKDPLTVVVDRQFLTGRFVEIIRSDFTSIAWMSSILVFTVLLITYGRIELALVSFIPMFITWLWILGIMGLFDIRFNIINIIISALIFGLGDDYSLFIMDGLLQEYKTGKKNLSSYRSSILLSAIMTIAGLGVLIFARHPALRSIALISIIGITCVVMISNTLIPLLFNFLIRNRVRKGFFPWTFMGLFLSAFSFTYFVVGSILLTIIGIPLIKLNPFFKEGSKRIYHFLLSRWTWSLMYIMGNLTKQIINPAKENFSKPAVVIANHQSFLDILIMTMLYPRVILFTNKWVWNSPVFGAVVRMADYYPIAMGAEESVHLLADRVKKGYSIVIFPEGTRSPDGTMKRFHKGAFFLAEKLQLDILPVLLHGTGYTMSKSDFLLKNGTCTVQYLPRITPGDTRFGNNYTERAKQVGRYFRNSYEKLKQQIEQPAYFREQLVYNYIYKGPVLEWYMRVKTSLEKNYELFNKLVPVKGRILDIGCGYGFMTYMLNFVHPEREMTGIDYDEEKIAVGGHCYMRNENIHFFNADVLTYPVENFDCIILADILHYLQPGQQEQVIEKCIQGLNPGGSIIIRDGNADLKMRHKGTKFTEFLSTRLIRFNKTSGKGLSFLSGKTIRAIANRHQLEVEEIDITKFTSNIVFVIKKAAEQNDKAL